MVARAELVCRRGGAADLVVRIVVTESGGVGVPASAVAAHQVEEQGRVDATAEQETDGNIAHELAADGRLVAVGQLVDGGGTRRRRIEGLGSQVPPLPDLDPGRVRDEQV